MNRSIFALIMKSYFLLCCLQKSRETLLVSDMSFHIITGSTELSRDSEWQTGQSEVEATGRGEVRSRQRQACLIMRIQESRISSFAGDTQFLNSLHLLSVAP